MGEKVAEVPDDMTQELDLFLKMLLVMIDTKGILFDCGDKIVRCDSVDVIANADQKLTGFVLTSKEV